MIDAFVAALVEAAIKAGTKRDVLETSFRSIVTANIDAIKRETSNSLTLQGWVPPAKVTFSEVEHALPEFIRASLDPKPMGGPNGAIGYSGADLIRMTASQREALDRIMYKFAQPDDQDVIILKPQYMAQYENGTLFDI